jgi:hypothetical protein
MILELDLSPAIENSGPHLGIKRHLHLDRIASSAFELGEVTDMIG